MFTIVLAVFFYSALAQGESVFDAEYFSDGKLKAANRNTHYSDMVGSPYFYDKWAPGEARLSDGKTYKDLFLKYDEVSNTLMFKYDLKDSAMVFQFQPLEFHLKYFDNNSEYGPMFLNGFEGIDGGSNRTFYQVLSTGKVKLLKREVKTLESRSDFASNSNFKQINTKVYYYVAMDTKITRLKNDKKSLMAAFPGQEDRVKKFIAENDIDWTYDGDLIKLVEYYNTL
jgi:hypothetical protein